MDKDVKGVINKNTIKEGILVPIPTTDNNNECCMNMESYYCNKCYIKEYKTDVNKNNNKNNGKDNDNNINKPLIDLHTKSKKYNIDNINFDINNNQNTTTNKITITIKKHL